MYKKWTDGTAEKQTTFNGQTLRPLSDYGKTVVVTQEEFEKSINPNRKVQEKVTSSTTIRSSHMISSAYSQDQKQKLRHCFGSFSTSKTVKRPPRSRLNANGVREVFHQAPQEMTTMSEEELGKLFISAGIPIHPHTLNHMFTQLIKMKGKGITFEDLMELLQMEDGSLDQESDYMKIFQMYDKKHRGYFEYQDYRLIGEGAAKFLTEGDLRAAFKAMDLQGTGRITFDMFVRVMKSSQ